MTEKKEAEDFSPLNIRIVALCTGEKLICQVKEAKTSSEQNKGQEQFVGYILQNPQVVDIHVPEVLTESADSETKVTFTPWMNLCLEKEFLVLPEQIVTMAQPRTELSELFHAKVGCHPVTGADGTHKGATVQSSLTKPDDWEPIPISDEEEAKLRAEYERAEKEAMDEIFDDVEEIPALEFEEIPADLPSGDTTK